MTIDLTPIFQAVIALLAALITYKLIPLIKARTTTQQQYALQSAARIAVFAAEQLFASDAAKIKLDYAIASLKQAGFTMDAGQLRNAVESAVKEMNDFPAGPAVPIEAKPPDPVEEPAPMPDAVQDFQE